MRRLPGDPCGTVVASGRRERGVTLVELLAATTIAAVVLFAAYGWVWNVASFAKTSDDRAQAATIAGAAARALARDIGASVAVSQPPAGRDRSRSLALLHDHGTVAPEQVLIVWDPARRVLWRNAPGTYIADRMNDVRLAFVLHDGRVRDPLQMMGEEWLEIAAIRVDLACTVGRATAKRTLCVALGPI